MGRLPVPGHRLCSTVVVLAALAASLAGSASGASAPVVPARPAALPQGPAPLLPHLVEGREQGGYVVDRVLVDGATRVRVPPGSVELLGRHGADHVLAVDRRLVRLTPQGAAAVLTGVVTGWLLTPGGDRVVTATRAGGGRRVLRVVDVDTGRVLHRTTVPGRVTLLDADDRRVVLATVGRRPPEATLLWAYRRDRVTTLSTTAAQLADLEGDRVAIPSDAVEQGLHCPAVRRVSDVRRVLWSTCRGTDVVAFGPDGLMLTSPAGTGILALRDRRGTVRAVYDLTLEERDGLDGATAYAWESPTALLLAADASPTDGTRQVGAVVRCTPTACEQAGPTWTVAPGSPGGDIGGPPR